MRMKMKQKWKRVLVSIMTIAMLASQMTAGVWATGESEHDCRDAECKHMDNHWTYTDNGNGTHKVTCTDCGTVETEAAGCVYVNGACGACGSECGHMGNHWTYTDNGNGTHKVTCTDCGTVVTETADCVYVNGVCGACGHKEPGCDHMGNNWEYVDNGNGTHKVICKDCNEVVTAATECVWENGNACVCGSVEAVETESEPETESESETESEPVTEEVTEDVTEEVSEKETDKVTEKTTEASKKTDTTEKTTDKDAVKTGDNTVVVPYIIVMAMAAALVVVVIKKRKVVK